MTSLKVTPLLGDKYHVAPATKTPDEQFDRASLFEAASDLLTICEDIQEVWLSDVDGLDDWEREALGKISAAIDRAKKHL